MAAVVAEHRPHQPRSEQNTTASFLLALAMHAMLVGALWISVKWNVEPSGAVVVELWGGGAPAEPVVVAPAAPPPAPPPPRAEPEPEKPNADIVVRQEKKAPPKVEPPPDAKKIEAEKRRLDAEKRAEEEKQKQRLAAEEKRREAEKRQLDLEKKKQAEAAERKRDDERREAVRKAEEARMLAQAAGGSPAGSATGSAGGRPGGTAAGAGGGDPGYAGQLVALIRPRIVFAVPENTSASVHAEFQVDLLPTGEILAVRKLRASGLPGYDEAVERAIRRTDPFPRRRDGTVERTVIIRFRPVDAQ